MTDQRLHICIVSDLVQANFIGLRTLGATHVLLLSSTTMRRRGAEERLQRLIRTQPQIKLQAFPEEMPNTDLATLEDFFLSVQAFVEEHYPEIDVQANLTGGNKLMTLAAYATWQQDFTLFYVDTDSRRIEFMRKKGEAVRTPTNIGNCLNIKQSLIAAGAEFVDGLSSDQTWRKGYLERREWVNELFQSALSERGQKAIATLNYEVSKIIDPYSDRLKHQGVVSIDSLQVLGALRKPLEAAADFGDIDFNFHSGQITLPSKDIARVLNGFWLEEYLYAQFQKIGQAELDTGVKIRWRNQGDKKTLVENEIDLMACENNRLLLIECKTQNLSKQADLKQDTVHKLNSIGQALSGPFGTQVLASVQPLAPHLRERALDRRIRVFEGRDLLRLPEAYAAWCNTGRIPT